MTTHKKTKSLDLIKQSAQLLKKTQLIADPMNALEKKAKMNPSFLESRRIEGKSSGMNLEQALRFLK